MSSAPLLIIWFAENLDVKYVMTLLKIEPYAKILDPGTVSVLVAWGPIQVPGQPNRHWNGASLPEGFTPEAAPPALRRIEGLKVH